MPDKSNMRLKHVAEADLNLLKPLYALLEERQITRAALRCGLSQPAMSRALERLRATFSDELLVRDAGHFARTPRAERLLVELQDLLPRLETALRGDHFEPLTSRHTFRIAATEYGATIVLPTLLSQLARSAPRMQVDLLSWNAAGVESVAAGRVDLALAGAHDCASLEREELFSDGFACLVSRTHPLPDKRPTLKAFISYPHVEIAVTGGRTPFINDALAAHGLRRRVTYRTAFPLSAIAVTAASLMIYTSPRRFANILATCADVRILDAPRELPTFSYAMAWHRRQRDDVVHTWLRNQVRLATAAV